MKKRYVKMSIWKTTKENMIAKKRKMEAEIIRNTGKRVNIPLTSLYDAISRKSIDFDLREIFEISRRKKK